jgi:hypothetical protein
MENTSGLIVVKSQKQSMIAFSSSMPSISWKSHRNGATLLCLLVSFFYGSVVHGQDWSEKDLIKSVHRAENTFDAGEMSRAYGLFAHLVSVAGDRPFLHYRFGAICTFTGTRLNEADEHLGWANELGILDTEHAGGWYFYTGKLRQLQYRFAEAKELFNEALKISKGDEEWLVEADLRYGQCDHAAGFTGEVKKIDLISSLESHSSDFFRLYQLPPESGRLLVTPESLLGKEDVKRGYTSIMHWLPGQRFAFFSSYGKKGKTGLDVYRVSVSSSGSYGVPERLPEPVNSDFDDSHPICIPAKDAYTDPDLLYFSSSRPESMGGMDIFKVFGLFTGESLGMVARETLEQLPFEINSTRDEWLFWLDETTNKGWVSTNRSKDFEGKEIWQFDWGEGDVDPVSIRFELASGEASGVLKVVDQLRNETILEHRLEENDSWDLIVGSQAELHLVWQDHQGINHPLHLTIPKVDGGQVALESAVLTSSEGSVVKWESTPSTFVPEGSISWSEAAFEARHQHGVWILETSNAESLSYRIAAESKKWEFGALESSSILSSESPYESFPNWFVRGMEDFENEDLVGVFEQLEPSGNARSKALVLQNKLVALSCWDAPGTNDWKAHDAILRYGEPVLASIAQEAIELITHVSSQTRMWDSCLNQIERNLEFNPEKEAEFIALKMYLDSHLQAYKGTENQSEDLIRRIDVHLQFNRWLSDALPITMADFQASLIHLSLNELQVTKSLRDMAQAIVTDVKPELALTTLQLAVWESLVDSIIDVQAFGVYDLPEMQPAQMWFLRSGALMDEVQTEREQLDAVSKGRRSVSLAWDALKEGKGKRDVVYADIQMSSGEWWEKFGPNENGGATEEFEGYELFLKGNSMLLDQAHLYQAELDHLRLVSVKSKPGMEAVKNAIAIRSNMATEMQSMFGPTDVQSSNLNSTVRKTNVVNVPYESSNSINSTSTSKTPNSLAYAASKEKIPADKLHLKLENPDAFFGIQVGVFRNLPDWSFNEEMLETQSLGNGLTRYIYGAYTSEQDATNALKTIVGSVPDAFILSRNLPAQKIKERAPKSETNTSTSPILSTPIDGTAAASSFRVKVASFGQTMAPNAVASLLRLGNEFNLKTVRLSESTTYYSESFKSELEATRVLGICLSNGFIDAVVEALD